LTADIAHSCSFFPDDDARRAFLSGKERQRYVRTARWLADALLELTEAKKTVASGYLAQSDDPHGSRRLSRCRPPEPGSMNRFWRSASRGSTRRVRSLRHLVQAPAPSAPALVTDAAGVLFFDTALQSNSVP
jgi:hypothetical protein